MTPPTSPGRRHGTGRGYAIGYLENVELGPDVFDYMSRIECTFEPYGGEWIVHGTDPEVLEGRLPGAIVIIGFPTLSAARDWYDSPGYREIVELRTRHSRSITVLVEGVPPGYRAAHTIAKLRASGA